MPGQLSGWLSGLRAKLAKRRERRLKVRPKLTRPDRAKISMDSKGRWIIPGATDDTVTKSNPSRRVQVENLKARWHAAKDLVPSMAAEVKVINKKQYVEMNKWVHRFRFYSAWLITIVIY